ncbi:hypothetical protein ACTJKN_20975 [Pedobacter sp. 22163]|uniref:hypothetical protein n=1 Tax=Pedobacter sp. 22163 TaxID=3453883 RepID=UPI003F8740A0
MLKTLNFKKLYSKDFVGNEASIEDISVKLIEESCIVNLEGAPPVAYFQERHPALNEIIDSINALRFNSSTRSANKGSQSILFGAVNRTISRMGFCTHGALVSRDPALHHTLCSTFAIVFNNLLKKYLPSRHKIGGIKTRQKDILPDYIMGASNFTSGIINRNSAFHYHKDGFNMLNTYSSMIVYKGGVSGGYLVLPEYGIGFKCPDQAIVQFYGKGILHGVTPIDKHSDNAYRISVVYYTSDGLDKCLTPSNELIHAQNL